MRTFVFQLIAIVICTFNAGSRARAELDLSPWSDIVSFRPASAIQRSAAQSKTHAYVQAIEDGVGDVNLDEYDVLVTQLPQSSGHEQAVSALFSYLRANLPEFLDPSISTFAEAQHADSILWNSSLPTGAIMGFGLVKFGVPLRTAYVVTSDYSLAADGSHGFWRFSPVNPSKGFIHPVSGNREFGFRKVSGGYLFYIKAADRISNALDYTVSQTGLISVFGTADSLWRSWQERFKAFIVENAGKTDPAVGVFSGRFSWAQIGATLWKPTTSWTLPDNFALTSVESDSKSQYVNLQGDIIGTSGGQARLWLADSATWQPQFGAAQNVDLSEALQINVDGTVVGAKAGVPAFWENGQLHLINIPGAAAGRSLGVNDVGWIVGEFYTSSPESGTPLPFIWRRPKNANAALSVDVSILPLPAGYDQGSAEAISLSGTVAGIVERNSVSSAVRWSGGSVQVLPTLGGARSLANAINDQGDVSGAASLPGGTLHAVVWENGTAEDLGTLGGAVSWAMGINNRGVVVGWSRTMNQGEKRAFVSIAREEDGTKVRVRQTFDLNVLAPNKDGWTYSYATSINDADVVVGIATKGAAQAAFAIRLPI